MLIESSPFQSIARPDLESNEFVESARSVTTLRVAEKQMASPVLMRKRVVDSAKEADSDSAIGPLASQLRWTTLLQRHRTMILADNDGCDCAQPGSRASRHV